MGTEAILGVGGGVGVVSSNVLWAVPWPDLSNLFSSFT